MANGDSGKSTTWIWVTIIVVVLLFSWGTRPSDNDKGGGENQPDVEKVTPELSAEYTENLVDTNLDLGPSPYSEVDPLWPTTNPQIEAIPESARWYTALDRVGETGTIAGPVCEIYQAVNSNGMPVFIDIGNGYPNQNRAQIVIWGERVSEFESMLNQIDDGGAWVSVTGYISVYDGVAQIDVNDGYTEWKWWTTS